MTRTLSTCVDGGGARLLTPQRRVQVLGRRSTDGRRLGALSIHVDT